MSLPQGRMLWVHLPYATYGVVVDAGVVVWSPPIARWMTGKPWAEVLAWLRARDARLMMLPR